MYLNKFKLICIGIPNSILTIDTQGNGWAIAHPGAHPSFDEIEHDGSGAQRADLLHFRLLLIRP